MRRSDFLKRILGAVVIAPVLPAVIAKATEQEVKLSDLLDGSPILDGSWSPKERVLINHNKLSLDRIRVVKLQYHHDELCSGKLWDECWEKLINKNYTINPSSE